MKHLFPSLILLGLILLPGSDAVAEPAVKPISSSAAQGLSGPTQTVVVWPGYGTSISFIQAEETVRKVFLSDPSNVVLKFDGPMCVVMGTGGNSGDCSNAGASMIYLQQIKSLHFPGLLSSKSGTLLTVVTTENSTRRINQFRIVYGRGKPTYNTLMIKDDQTPLASTNVNRTEVNYLIKGLQLATAQGLIRTGGQTWSRVQQVGELMQKGTSAFQAAQKAGLPFPVVLKLEQMGASSTATLSPATLTVRTPRDRQETMTSQKSSGSLDSTPASAGQRQGDGKPSQLLVASAEPKPATPATPPDPAQSTPGLKQPASLHNQRSSNTVHRPSQPQLEKAVSGIQEANAVVRGLLVADHKGQISYQSRTYKQVQNVIYWLRRGKTKNEAVAKAKVSLKLVNQLLTWGGIAVD